MAKNDTAAIDTQESTVSISPSSPVARVPDYHLIVRHPFGNYGKGSHIKDADEIDGIMAGEYVTSVHKIAVQP